MKKKIEFKDDPIFKQIIICCNENANDRQTTMEELEKYFSYQNTQFNQISLSPNLSSQKPQQTSNSQNGDINGLEQEVSDLKSKIEIIEKEKNNKDEEIKRLKEQINLLKKEQN